MPEHVILQPAEDQETDLKRRFGLSSALAAAIGAALLLTSVSTTLYLSSNFSRIDLSKPKNADVRSQVTSVSDDDQIDTSGPVTRDSIKEMREHMQAAQASLKKSGSFDSPVLEDATLGIGASEQAPQ